MFIQIEKTPDPAALKFLPGRAVLPSGSMDFADRDAAARSPLAARLFDVVGVTAVSLGPDFIAVTKTDAADWQILKPAVLGIIMEHFLANAPVVLAEQQETTADFDPEDADLVTEILELLDRRIRPSLASEGGDVALRGFRDGTVELEVLGTVTSAPLFTVKVRIENTLRHYVPEVERVEFAEPRPSADAAGELDMNDPEVVAVHTLLEERINPSVAAHGGHISLIDVKDHTAYIRLEGGCQGCGMADVTLKQGIEQTIKQAVPSIIAVLDSTDHAGGENPFYEPDKGGMSPF